VSHWRPERNPAQIQHNTDGTNMPQKHDPRRGVLVPGYAGIGDYLGLTERQVEHNIAHNGLPVFHLGRSVVARREALDQWVVQQESKAPPQPPALPPLRRYTHRRAAGRR
jgi:hypothetical protein